MSDVIFEDPLVPDWQKFIPIDDIDEELRDLILVLNMLPGIRTTSCCIGHPMDGWHERDESGKTRPSTRWRPAGVFFGVHPTTDVGLFILTRCSDRRYWRFGGCWSIQLSVSDLMSEDGLRPTSYELFSSTMWGEKPIVLTKKWAVVSVRSLIASIWEHLFGDVSGRFLDYYKLPPRSFWEPLWPKTVRGPLTEEEKAIEEQTSFQIDRRFFPDELAMRSV